MKSAVVLRLPSLLAILSVLLSVVSVRAADLNVGNPAPKLQTGKWVQGDPVKEFDRDKIYLVEFWATWCGPCKVSIPHLNELHNKFKDKGLVVIGQNCWERDESLVKPFIEKMGDKMTYRVALDDKSGDETGKMAETWMKAAGQNGIPSAFLVNKKGDIAWIGHPMTLKESIIEQVLSGSYDVKKAAEEAKAAAKNQAAIREHALALNEGMRDKDWDKAEKSLEEIKKLLPAEQRSGIDMARLQILLGKHDYDAAYQLAEKISDAHKDDAMFNNQLAWDLATRQDIKTPNFETLDKIATTANTAAEGKNPAVLDTLARVKFMAGKKSEAVRLQQKAVDLAEADMKDALKETLASYREGKLPDAQ